MPRQDDEPREEDAENKISWQEGVVKTAQLPSRNALPANTILPLSLTTLMAQLATIGDYGKMLLNHQIDKAEVFLKALPLEKQADYKNRIDKARDFKLLSDELIYHISMFSLSTNGIHHDLVGQLAKQVVTGFASTDVPKD